MMRTSFALFFSISLSIVLCSSPALAEDEASSKGVSEKRVGVTVAAVINAPKEHGDLVVESLAKVINEELLATGHSGPAADASLPPEARQEACLGSTACLVNAATAMGVDELLVLIVLGAGEQVTVEATWVDPVAGTTALRSSLDLPLLKEDMILALRSRIHQLLPGIDDRPANAVVSTTPNLVTAVDKSQAKIEPTSSSMSTATKVVLIGGGAYVAGWAGFGLFRLTEGCRLFSEKKGCGDRDSLAKPLDYVGFAVLGTMAVATYLHLTKEEAPSRSVGLIADSETLGMSYGGRF